MPDQQSYLRFPGRISGRSTYRTHEGWIDVLAHSPGDPPGFGGGSGGGAGRRPETGEYRFAINGHDPVTPLIAQASSDGMGLGTAVLDVRGARSVRLTMTDVMVRSYTAGETFHFTLAYAAMTVTAL